jgi:hypothetical protein
VRFYDLAGQSTQEGRGVGPESRQIEFFLFIRDVSITFGTNLVVIKTDITTLRTFHLKLLILKNLKLVLNNRLKKRNLY